MIGFVAMVVVLCIDYRRIRELAMVFYGGTVFLLVAVLAPVGSNIKGHQAWFQLPGGFTLQPSELAKFGIIVALAGYCNQYRGEFDAWRAHRDHRPGRASRSVSCCCSPTSGPCWCCAVIVVAILAVAGVSGKQLMVLGLLAVTGVYAVVGLGLLKQYQLDRLTTFLDPESGTSQGTAYNQRAVDPGPSPTGGLTGEGWSRDPRPRAASSPSSTPTSSSPRWGRSSGSSARSCSSRCSPS